MKVSHSLLPRFARLLFGGIWLLFQAFLIPGHAATLEGKSLKLTLPAEAVPTNNMPAWAEELDYYAWNFAGRDGGGTNQLQRIADLEKETRPLLEVAREDMAKSKRERNGPDTRWTGPTLVALRNPGWKAAIYRRDSEVRFSSGEKLSATEHRLVLFGAGKVWRCVVSGDQRAIPRVMTVLESAVFKKTDNSPASPADLALTAQETRTWTNAAGQTFEGKAFSASLDGRFVSIERIDGQKFLHLPLTSFAAKDQQFLRAVIDNAKQQASAAR